MHTPGWSSSSFTLNDDKKMVTSAVGGGVARTCRTRGCLLCLSLSPSRTPPDPTTETFLHIQRGLGKGCNPQGSSGRLKMNLSPKSYVFLTSCSKAGKPSSPYEVARGRDWYGRTETAPAACNARARLEAKREGWQTSVQRWTVCPSVKLVYLTHEKSHCMVPLACKSRIKKNSLCRLLIHTPAGRQPAPLGAKADRFHCNSDIH